MSDGPRTARVRASVRGLLALCARCAETESRLERDRAEALAGAQQSHDARVASAATLLEATLAQAEADHAAGRAAAQSDAQSALDRIKLTGDAELAQLKERADRDKTAGKKRLQDDSWMAETLSDSALRQSKDQFEAIAKKCEEQAVRLKELRAEADLAVFRLTRLEGERRPEWMQPPSAPRAAPAAGSDAEAAPETVDADSPSTPEGLLEAAQAKANVALNTLSRLFVPTLIVQPLPFIYAPIVGVGAGVLVSSLRQWRVDGLAVGVGAGAMVLGLVGFMWLARAAMGRVLKVARPAYSALAAGERANRQAMESALAARAAADGRARSKMERTIALAKAQYEEIRTELVGTYEHRVREAQQRIAGEQAAVKAVRDRRLAEADQRRTQRLTDARQAHEWEVTSAAASLAGARKVADSDFTDRWAALITEWHDGVAAHRASLAELMREAEAICPAWDSPRWSAAPGPGPSDGWPGNASNPMAVCFGELTLDLAKAAPAMPKDPRLALSAAAGDAGAGTIFKLPGLMELPDRCSILIQAGGEAKGAKGDASSAAAARRLGLDTLRAVMLRALASLPPGKVRLTVLDPVGLGESFAGFMHLTDYDPLLISDRIWTEPRHIEQKLSDLTEHMEVVIQKYLRNQFTSIEHYNEHAGEIAEPYRLLCIADFPANFNEQSAKRLASILTSGPRCGVYTLIAMDPRAPLPAGISANELKLSAVRLTAKREPAAADGSGGGGGGGSGGVRLVWDDPDFASLPLRPAAAPADAEFSRAVHRMGHLSKDSRRVEVPFASIAPQYRDPNKLWSRDSGSIYTVAMGKAGATKLQDLTLGRGTAQHALIAGRTGSGKSTLLHAIITNTALWYSPDQVEMYLIDFKKGVEFRTYAANVLPHARVVAIESEREFGLSVLRRLDGELKRRGELYRQAEVQDVAGFRVARPGEPLPRVLLIIDEFQELFVEDDKLAQETGLLLDRLVRQGRAFGMHAILGSQTLGGAYSLARSTIGQMAVRIALQCSEADALLIMGDDNTAPRLLTRPGEAIYNDASGAIEANSPFQVSWLPDEQRDEALAAVSARAKADRASGRLSARPEPIVFEGNAQADPARNEPLTALLKADGYGPTPGAPLAWLGDPVAIKEPTAASLRRQAAANLLIVGQRDEQATAMVGVSLVGLGAQIAPSAGARFFVLDGTPADATLAGYLPRVAGLLPHGVSVVAYRDVPAVLAEIAAEVARRQASGEESGASSAAPWVLVVHGVQRFRQLRRNENEFDFSAPAEGVAAAPDKLLAEILREGAAVGVHTIMWADTLASVNRSLDRQSLREFDQRVLFQMSGADSSALIDTPVAGGIGNNRALYHSEELGAVEKFRPYGLPSEEWLAWAAGRLQARRD